MPICGTILMGGASMIDNDRILGCLLAGAFGDAFCAPFEGVDKDEAWKEYDKEEYVNYSRLKSGA